MTIIKDNSEYGNDLYVYIENGMCRLTISPKCHDVAFMSMLVVDEAHREQGVGNSILAVAESIAKQNGCKVITLQTSTGWTMNWYARHGFTVVGEGYEDGMVMMSKFL